MQGDLFQPEIIDFHEVALRLQGNISAIARYYTVTNNTIYNYLYRTPNGMAVLEKCRKYNTESDLDLAEFVIRYNLSKMKEKPGIAQKAAEFLIKGKGQSRGWNIQDKTDGIDGTLVNKIDEHMKMLREFQGKEEAYIPPLDNPYDPITP